MQGFEERKSLRELFRKESNKILGVNRQKVDGF